MQTTLAEVEHDVMAKPRKPRPTNSELQILGILWERGPSTVREVYEAVSAQREAGYTTVLKLMQVMLEKKLLQRDESRRPHVYEPAMPAEKTRVQLVRDLIDRAFAGSAQKLVLHALSSKKVSPAEMQQIRKLLDQLEGDRS